MQLDEAKENSPDVGAGDCSIADDELDAALIEMLGDVTKSLNGSLASTSELAGMHLMLDSWFQLRSPPSQADQFDRFFFLLKILISLLNDNNK